MFEFDSLFAADFLLCGDGGFYYLAAHPKAGDLMEGTGGVRKLGWGRGAQGKSGGVRVIYYVPSEMMPLYLLTLFAKNERANISKSERNELAELVELLVEIWLEP